VFGAVLLAASLGAHGQQFYTDTPAISELPVENAEELGSISKLPLLFSVSVREGYDDNVFATDTNREGSFFTNFGLGTAYEFGSSRLQLRTAAGGGVTYYYSRPGDKVDLTGNVSLIATYLATPRLTLSFSTYTAYISQPDYNVQGTSASNGNQNGDYFYSANDLTANYSWTDLISTTTRYNITGYVYADSSLNDSQGRIEQTIGQSFNYLLLPKTTVIAEYRANPITYYQADLNSFGNFFLVGIDQIFNPRFQWNSRLGVEWRFTQNPTDGEGQYVGPYMESTLTYSYAKRSNLSWTMRYGTEASGLADVTERQTFRTAFNLQHSITARLSANANLGYQFNYYDQANVITSYYENVVDAGVQLTFNMNRIFNVNLGYTYSAVFSDNSDREYYRNIVYLGSSANF